MKKASTAGERSFLAGGRVILFANPKAGAGESQRVLAEVLRELRERRFHADLYTDPQQGFAEVSRWVDRYGGAPGEKDQEGGGGELVVIAAGGDGTMNLVAGGIPAGVPIVPFPLGTENLLARHFGLTRGRKLRSAAAIVSAVVAGRNHSIDAGEVSFLHARSPTRARRLMLLMLSSGFDAETVRRVELGRLGHIRRWSYAKPILQMVRRYHYPPIVVRRGEGQSWGDALTVAWAFVFNLPCYATALQIEPEAEGADGLLNFCGFERGSHAATLRYLMGILTQRHMAWGDVRRELGTRFLISCERPLAVQIDGDYAGRLPVEIRVLPQRVTLRLPKESM